MTTDQVQDIVSPFSSAQVVSQVGTITYGSTDGSLSKTNVLFSDHNPKKNSFYHVDIKLDGDSDLWSKYQEFTLSGTEDKQSLRSRARPGANLYEFLNAASLFGEAIDIYDTVALVYNTVSKTYETGKLSIKADVNGLTYIFNKRGLYYPVIRNADIANQVGAFGTSEGHRAISNVYGLSLYNDQFIDASGDKLIIMASTGWETPAGVFDTGIAYQKDDNGAIIAAHEEFGGSINSSADPSYSQNFANRITALPVYVSSTGFFENPVYYLSPLFSLFVKYHKPGIDDNQPITSLNAYPRVSEISISSHIKKSDTASDDEIPLRQLRPRETTNFVQSNPSTLTTGFPFVLTIIADSVDLYDSNIIYKGGFFAGKYYGPRFDAMGGMFSLHTTIDSKDYYYWGVLAQTSYANQNYLPSNYSPPLP